MNHPGGARFEVSPADTDSLLQTLLWVCSRNGVKKSAASFLDDLPSTDRVIKVLCRSGENEEQMSCKTC